MTNRIAWHFPFVRFIALHSKRSLLSSGYCISYFQMKFIASDPLLPRNHPPGKAFVVRRMVFFFTHREQQKPISFELNIANISVANPSTRYAMKTSHIRAYLISTFLHFKQNKINFVCLPHVVIFFASKTSRKHKSTTFSFSPNENILINARICL